MLNETGHEIVMRNRIAEWRRARGLTQEELAEQVGAHYTTVNRLENKKQGLSQKWLEKLSRVLEVHPSDLIGDGDIEDIQSHAHTLTRDEVEVYTPDLGHWLEKVQLTEKQRFYRIMSGSLSALDISEGSIVIADFSADAVDKALRTPEKTSIVLCQYHYDPDDFANCLMLPRQFVPPYTLIRNSLDKRPEPLVLDDHLIELVAIVSSTVRDL
jgi:transcriptional regulator with XRE-family HTH domain